VNIGLTQDGRAKLLDYGLAAKAKRRDDGGAGGTFTLGLQTAEAVHISPGYTPEEVVYGKYGAGSDIYSFGMVMFELLTGRRVTIRTRFALDRATSDSRPLEALEAMADQKGGRWHAGLLRGLVGLIMSCVKRDYRERPKQVRGVLLELIRLREAAADDGQRKRSGKRARLDSLLAQLQAAIADMDKESQDSEAGVEETKGGEPPPEPDDSATEVCCVCQDSFPRSGGLFCKVEGYGHFTCHGDLKGWLKREVSIDRMRKTMGALSCPGLGCESAPWQHGDLAPHLDAGSLREYCEVLQGTLKQFMEGERRRVEFEAEHKRKMRRLAEEQLQEDARVEALRRVIIEDFSYLRCPS
jgi:hypothetical protein